MRKKKKYARIKQYRDHQTTGYASLDLSSVKHRPIILMQIFGFFLTICASIIGLLSGVFFIVALLSLFSHVNSSHRYPDALIGIAIVLSCACMISASPLLRYLCYALKRAYLGNTGIMAEATVVGYRNSFSRGPDQFDLLVAWQHPVSGQTFIYERHYTFFWELFNPKKDDLFKSYYAGAYLPVRFNPRKPQQFILEIPFKPCWFDIFF